jgi:hypothetical protein
MAAEVAEVVEELAAPADPAAAEQVVPVLREWQVRLIQAEAAAEAATL